MFLLIFTRRKDRKYDGRGSR